MAIGIITLLCSVPAQAQATISTGNIQGVVSDQTNAMVTGAKVTITNRATGQKIETTSNSSGAYNSGTLIPGNYTIRVEAKGFQTTQMAVVVQVGVVTSGNVKLTIGSEGTVVEVSADAVRVNTEQPSVQGVLTSTQIENLPIAGRNFLDLAQLEPGVQIQDGGNFDPTKNGFSSISFGGRAGRTARISVDGLDVSDETVGTTTQNIPLGAIQEFQLSQSTLDLSTELTSSGAVNLATKAGTNTVHGEGFYLFRDKSMDANFPGGQNTPYQRNHFGGTLGGPIVKDKLFWSATAEHIKQDLLVPLQPPAPFTNIPKGYLSPFRDTQTLGRLDWNAPHGVRLFYRFTYNFSSDVAAYGGTYQPFANRNNTPSHAVGADFTTGDWTHSFRYGHLKFQNHIADAVLGNTGLYNPAGDLPVAIRIGPAGVITRFGPSRLAPQATFQQDDQIKYDGSHLKGSHVFRYGVSFNRIRGGGFASFYGIAPEIRTSNGSTAQAVAACATAAECAAAGWAGSLMPFPGGASNPLNYPISSLYLSNGQGFFTEVPAFGYPAGGQWDNRLGLYFGDTWKIKPNFTLTYGLRYSRDTGRADSDMPAMTCDQIDASLFSILPCTGKSRILDQFGAGLGAKVRQPNSNFGPQFGFAWDPKNNGKWVIRGGSGIYYENAIFNNVLFDRPGRLTKGLFWGTASPCSFSPAALVLPSGPVTSVTLGGQTISLDTLCTNARVGEVMGLVAQLQQYYQQQVVAAGVSSNPNFIGQNLANGDNSTGNNFISPTYRTPRSIQMNIGIQHEIKPGLVASADFIRNVGLHYLIAYDTNHVGDARYLNKAAAQNAIAATLAACGVGSIDAAITSCPGLHATGGATIDDFAVNGLDSGQTYFSGYPASYFGLSPNTGAAFAGVNPLVGENTMLFPDGRSTYTGLQLKLTQNFKGVGSILKGGNFQFSYSLSRFNSMVSDQDFVVSAYDNANPGKYFGPTALDRTHQFSFGGTFDLPHGPRLSLMSHFFSPLAQDIVLQNQLRAGEIFFTDFNGAGLSLNGNPLPGTDIGSFGREFTGSNINKAIDAYNSTYAGKLTPAGQALVSAGLFTTAQLTSLGAVADVVPRAPSDQVNLGWLHSMDLTFTWPIKVRERFSIEPSVGFFNLFNFANFDSPSNYLNQFVSSCPFGTAPADCTAAAGTINGSSKSKLDHDATRVGIGTGVNTQGSPRQIEWGLKIKF